MTTLNTAIAETISNYLAELLGQQPGGPTDLDKGLAADILSLPLMVDLMVEAEDYDQLREDRETAADAWDEGMEAGFDYSANQHTPSGIPNDPPSNPYLTLRGLAAPTGQGGE